DYHCCSYTTSSIWVF
nr:immunoglobulin light chain junction region [Macaca mulatta]